MLVEQQYMCLVLYDDSRTNSISRVFSKWQRSKRIGPYQCNFDFILDHRRQTLLYLRSNINRCLQKYHELVTTLFRSTTSLYYY